MPPGWNFWAWRLEDMSYPSRHSYHSYSELTENITKHVWYQCLWMKQLLQVYSMSCWILTQDMVHCHGYKGFILLLILRILSRVILMSRGSNAPVKTDLKGWNKATISGVTKVSKNITIWPDVWLLRVFAAWQCGGTTSMFSSKAFPESPLTIQDTYILPYVLDGKIIWTILWCELPCLRSLRLCFWLEILWGWYWVFFSEKNQAFNQTSCYQASQLKAFRISWVPGD